MKVYWIENKEGQYYGSSRYFTDNGPPKLYGSMEVLRRSLGTASRWANEDNPPGSLPEHFVVCEGLLVKKVGEVDD